MGKRLDTAASSIPGYNIYVGLNQNAEGRWNQADIDLLYYYNDLEGYTPADAQRAMYNEATNRIASGEINFPQLFYKKFHHMWGDDTAAVGYGSDSIPYLGKLSTVSNAFYLFTVLLSLVGALIAMKKRKVSNHYYRVVHIGINLGAYVC